MSPQDTRRVLHGATALIVVAGLGVGWSRLRFALGVALPAVVLFEICRIRISGLRNACARFAPVFRRAEGTRPSGAFWLFLGFLGASWLPPPGPVAGILVGALADPAASFVGSRINGRVRKSWPGTGAAFVVALVVLLGLGLRPLAVLGGALVGAGLERWSGPLDDNLLVAPGVASCVYWFG